MVADRLTQIAELALEPPSERAEPEQGGIESGYELKVEVALSNVRALVGEDNAQLLRIPLDVIGGQQHGRANRDRRGNSMSRTDIQPGSEFAGPIKRHLLRAEPQPECGGNAEHHAKNENDSHRHVK